MLKYQSVSTQIGYHFVPLVFETYGGWCAAAVRELGRVADCVQRDRGIPAITTCRKWRRILTFAHMRATATCINDKCRRVLLGPGAANELRSRVCR